jgi:hypothetical protein
MTGQRRPLGWAVLVGVLCAAILVGLSFARGTAAMTGVAHSERGPSSASFVTSTTVAAPSSDPDPTDVALPAASPRGPVGLAAAPPVQVPVTPAVVAAAPQAVASGVVRQGAFCARDAAGQTGYTSSGTKMICTYADGEDQPRWRADGPTQPKPSKASERQDQEQQDEEQQDQEDQQEPTNVAPTTVKASSSPQPANFAPFRAQS